MDSPSQTITVRGGDFGVGKVAESYVGYGVVGKSNRFWHRKVGLVIRPKDGIDC